jgi:uncharacterized protein YcaQ
LAELIEGVRATLSSDGITREQLAAAVATHTGNPKLLELLPSGWGALLKPVAFQGYLCFGPNQGQNVTFVSPAHWLGEWPPADQQEAVKELVRRYLTAYGPATADDFANWLGMEPADAKKGFRALGDEVLAVDVEGWKAWALASTLEQLQTINAPQKAPQSVVLLPGFDPYVIAASRHSQYILPKEYKTRVFRPQGWISPVVLIDGHMAGVWEYDKQRGQIVVKVSVFTPPGASVKQRIDSEVTRLGAFLGIESSVTYANE